MKRSRLSTRKATRLGTIVMLVTLSVTPSFSDARNVAIKANGNTYYVDAKAKRKNEQLVDLLVHSELIDNQKKRKFLKTMSRISKKDKASLLRILLQEQQIRQQRQQSPLQQQRQSQSQQSQQSHQISLNVAGETYYTYRNVWDENTEIIKGVLGFKHLSKAEKQQYLDDLPTMTAAQKAQLSQLIAAKKQASRKVPTTPILRPNTTMHTTVIWSAAIDKDERFLVTASGDKTAKVWSLQNGELLQTLRVPIGGAPEGKLYATAIDPNGEWIAVAGYTGYQWDSKASVYLFDRRSGQLLRRLSGLPETIKHLCVSDDSSRLAAILGDKSGVRVWNTADWSQAWQDSDYGNNSNSCDFAGDNRLATTALDGYLRLYNPEGRLLKKQRTVAGERPFGVAFNPAGDSLAVGFDDNTQVVVYNANTLDKRFAADTSAFTDGDLSKVAWSTDGRFLYAGGGYVDGSGMNPVIRWAQGGRGEPTALPGGNNNIDDLLPLKSGDLVVAAGDPTWLQLTANGKVKQQQHNLTVDNRGKIGSDFLLAQDGQQIAFGLDYGGEQPVSFSLNERRLQSLSSEQFKQLPAQGFITANTNKLAVSDWQNQDHPTLSGKPLSLIEYEISRSLAIAPDNDSFLLGTDWFLRRFNAQGQQNWQAATPAVAWGVNLSADGKLAVAALGDGTVRWYRYRDGQELLALFIDKQSMEWVLWTPSGYYDASPNGDKLIGWHVNNGKDKTPDFYPAKTLRKQFYRPQVVAQTLNTLDEEKAVEVANQMGEETDAEQTIATVLPPMVKIISHHDGDSFNKENITLKVNITRNNGTAKLKVLIDGEPMAKGRGLAALATDKQQSETLDVTLPKRDVTVSVIAENQMGASPAASVRLKWAGKTTNNNASANGGFVVKPKLYVLAVGVSKYRDPHLRLDFPAKDAADFVKVLQGQQDKLYREVEVKLLTDADKDDIIDGLDWLRENVTAKDVTMLFLSGHGANDRDNNYQFVAADTDVKRLYRSGVSYTDIKNTLTGLSGKRLAFIDTCHSGNIFGTKSKGLSPMADINGIVNDLTAAENGVVVFAASTGKQLSWEDPKWGNGAFTKAVVEGLGGKADYTQDGKITINQLDLYISERVKKLTDNRQTPVTTKPETVPDFPIGVVK